MDDKISESINCIKDPSERRALQSLFDKVLSDIGNSRCEILTETTQLKKADSGKTFFLNSATEFATTLPSVAEAGLGWKCKFIIKAAPASASYTIVEKATADTDVIYTNGINELEVDSTEDGPTSAGHTTITFADGVAIVGDWCELICDGTYFYCTGQTSADGGISLS